LIFPNHRAAIAVSAGNFSDGRPSIKNIDMLWNIFLPGFLRNRNRSADENIYRLRPKNCCLHTDGFPCNIQATTYSIRPLLTDGQYGFRYRFLPLHFMMIRSPFAFFEIKTLCLAAQAALGTFAAARKRKGTSSTFFETCARRYKKKIE
jgi:hypothetical protein